MMLAAMHVQGLLTRSPESVAAKLGQIVVTCALTRASSELERKTGERGRVAGQELEWGAWQFMWSCRLWKSAAPQQQDHSRAFGH